MRLRKIVSTTLMTIAVISMSLVICTAQEYGGLVLDVQELQGIKRLLVAWNKGNSTQSAAKQAVERFNSQKLQNVKVDLWDGQPFDLTTFDALLLVDSFHLSDTKETTRLYSYKEHPLGASLAKHLGEQPGSYIPTTITADVEAAWCTIYLLPVTLQLEKASPPRPVPRRLGTIVYINSGGKGELKLDNSSDLYSIYVPNDPLRDVVRSLVDLFIADMKIIDPTNWQ
jgi:hypothetical protein